MSITSWRRLFSVKLLGEGLAGFRVVIRATYVRVDQWLKLAWAHFLWSLQQVLQNPAVTKAKERWKYQVIRLLEIARRAPLSRWYLRLSCCLGAAWQFFSQNWRRIQVLLNALLSDSALIGPNSAFGFSSRSLVEDGIILSKRGNAGARSTLRALVACLSLCFIRWGLAMIRKVGSNHPAPIYLWNGIKFILVDPWSPLEYFRQIRTSGDQNQGEGAQLVGFPRPPETDTRIQEEADPEFTPLRFLTILFVAYLNEVESRPSMGVESAPVVPLVDVYSRIIKSRAKSKNYSEQQFIQDIFRLHASGQDTTENGAKVSFPISRGVPGKTLTTVNEAGGEVRYYGIRFIQRSSVLQS